MVLLDRDSRIGQFVSFQEIIPDIYRSSDAEWAVGQLLQDEAILFHGGGVYAFAAATKVGLQKIASVKKRDLLERPPVTATAWENVAPLVDWNLLTGSGITQEELSGFFQKLHSTLPVVVIYPVVREKAEGFIGNLLNNDWAERIVWGNNGVSTLAIDTLAYPGVKRLVDLSSKNGMEALFFTSANMPGDPTIARLSEVQATFQLPILTDPFMDLMIAEHEKHGYTGWSSYTSLDATRLKEGVIGIGRYGSVSHRVIGDFVNEVFGDDRVRIDMTNTTGEPGVPGFNDLRATEQLFTEISTHLR